MTAVPSALRNHDTELIHSLLIKQADTNDDGSLLYWLTRVFTGNKESTDAAVGLVDNYRANNPNAGLFDAWGQVQQVPELLSNMGGQNRGDVDILAHIATKPNGVLDGTFYKNLQREYGYTLSDTGGATPATIARIIVDLQDKNSELTKKLITPEGAGLRSFLSNSISQVAPFLPKEQHASVMGLKKELEEGEQQINQIAAFKALANTYPQYTRDTDCTKEFNNLLDNGTWVETGSRYAPWVSSVLSGRDIPDAASQIQKFRDYATQDEKTRKQLETYWIHARQGTLEDYIREDISNKVRRGGNIANNPFIAKVMPAVAAQIGDPKNSIVPVYQEAEFPKYVEGDHAGSIARQRQYLLNKYPNRSYKDLDWNASVSGDTGWGNALRYALPMLGIGGLGMLGGKALGLEGLGLPILLATLGAGFYGYGRQQKWNLFGKPESSINSTVDNAVNGVWGALDNTFNKSNKPAVPAPAATTGNPTVDPTAAPAVAPTVNPAAAPVAAPVAARNMPNRYTTNRNTFNAPAPPKFEPKPFEYDNQYASIPEQSSLPSSLSPETLVNQQARLA